ncbi:MAG: corrinoid protein [archaeon YNP-LCB-003-016]|uniref:cobalamin B12-binding domain-containing protein n=1 Tax=Candidatus Culexarchaeum yellowstonense TaxID=2928963 RepID=UPI0026EB0703|nr:corrinoid protein [Candidatus Culexarchaeum yellowstonense]MCR6692366.1 corrinoid protein [Candidatus Culexarchaeum yellowstonense]
MNGENLYVKLKNAILEFDVEASQRVAEEIVRSGADPLMAIKEGISEAAKIVGEKFESGEIFLTQLMLAGEAMKSALSVLLKALPSGTKVAKGKVVIGTVQGDIHEIGKNIVAALLSANGFDVYDLGVDVPSLKFIEEAERVKADVIAMSALMTSTIGVQKDVIDALKSLGLRDKYIVVVGGGATTAEWAENIGADGWAETAPEAVNVISRLIEKRGRRT